MLRAPVVPERHRVLAPAETALELGRRAVLHHKREQRVALGLLELLEAGREPFIYVERLTAGHRMSPYRRVLGRRVGPVAQVPATIAAHVVLLTIMHRSQLTQEPL